jgi:3-phosphoshikimate 1-carboxyvinyltransferase
MPPDKSISHRAAMFAAMSDETSTIQNYSEAADPQSTLSCLKKLGVSIKKMRNIVKSQALAEMALKHLRFRLIAEIPAQR